MSYLKFLLFLPLYLVVRLLNYILALPLAILSIALGVKTLPGILAWFHTHDDDLDGGQHQLGWPKEKGWKLILQRTKWMCRNAAYGFRATVLGFPSEGSLMITYKQKGPEHHIYTIISKDGKKYFGYRTSWCWFGWRYPESGGYHIYKCSLRKT